MTTQSASKDDVKVQVRVAARPETVFSFFTDPAKVQRWKGRSVEMDCRPGGAYRVVINDNDRYSGKYLEVKPYTRIVFTFGWEGDNPIKPGSTTVEVTLVPDGDDTVVTLIHKGLPTGTEELHGKGWQLYLGRLEKVAVGEDPGPDPNAQGSDQMHR